MCSENMLRVFKVFCVITVIVLFLLLVYYSTMTITLPDSERIDTSKTKHILYWNPFWEQEDYYIGTGYQPFKQCKFNNCYATADRNYVPLNKYDALVFHGVREFDEIDVPSVREPHQVYIYMNTESPPHEKTNVKLYNSFFNWTWTYRYDSDIVQRYGRLVKEETNYSPPSNYVLNQKRKLVAWFASNCNSGSKREILVRKMQEYVPVDVYGACGNLTCARQGVLSTDQCYSMVEKEYKFYISFENAHCKNYATEKLYWILKRDIVPIVYGGDNYSFSAPPNSVINVEDFQNVQQLVDYMKVLDENNNEYLKYLKWKQNFVIKPIETACLLCNKLHEPLKQSIYKDLYSWYWGENNSTCEFGKNLPRIVSDLL